MSEYQSPNRHVVGEDGDVVLVVGAEDSAIEILVSSKAISLASTVFAAMLKPQFSEGAALASTGQARITLHNDHPDAMIWLCKAAHRNPDFELIKSLNFRARSVFFRTSTRLMWCSKN